jgi:hypothetical protein
MKTDGINEYIRNEIKISKKFQGVSFDENSSYRQHQAFFLKGKATLYRS